MTITLRQATQKDVESYYGGLPLCTMRGIVAVKDGEVIGLGGTYKYQGYTVVFCDMRENAKKHKKHIIKAARMVLANLCTGRVFAICDTKQESAPRFLGHLGFELIDPEKNVYMREV